MLAALRAEIRSFTPGQAAGRLRGLQGCKMQGCIADLQGVIHDQLVLENVPYQPVKKFGPINKNKILF